MKVILTPEEEKLFSDCISVYGLENQLGQYIEECLEGALAARKFLRISKNPKVTTAEFIDAKVELLKELVDTSIMSEQIKRAFDSEADYELMEETHEYKINRQIIRVSKNIQDE